ncbi:MAG TPA: methyltransferase domain-containing protein [Pyrinomonadaceae bacterium]|nr:methyltransferase domain-containing protein [Pyrinomonadaceae bacterium]
MPTDNAAFVGSIPENYDQYLGPAMFDPYAKDLVARLEVPENATVLEIACGTGIVTRRLRDQLPPSTKIIATDLNDAMMNYAGQKFRPEENVEWKPADATELPFADASFDAVVCQFGLMFFPDKPKAAGEVYRVLKPGGSFLFNVWDAIEQNEMPDLTHKIVSSYFEDNPPDFYDIPFSYYDRDTLRSLLASAGFNDIDVSVVALPEVADSAQGMAHGFIHGNPLINAINERNAALAPEIEAAVAKSIASRFGDGPVRAKMQAVVCTARK